MRITFTVTAEIDPEWLQQKAFQVNTIRMDLLAKKTAECENALADALAHKDRIVAGSVTVQKVDQ